MISKNDLERVIAREDGGKPVLSLFLDMSVNSDNKRTHQVFLNQKRAQFHELDGNQDGPDAEAVGETFERIQTWIDGDFDQENRGVVIYAEVGGDWFEALQFPVPVANRIVIDRRPAVGPLAQVISTYHHHGVVLMDREHVRILSVYLGSLLDEIEVRGEPFPTSSHVQAGGYSQPRYQRRKAEEMRHFFKEFSKEVTEFVRRYKPDDLILLGTEENVGKFREFLPETLQEMVIHTGHMRVDEAASEVVAGLEPHLALQRERESTEILTQVRDRVEQDYLASAGFQSTLVALQEGRVDTLVIAQDQEILGSRCSKCGFIFARELGSCPYDGGTTEPGVDVVEATIRIAEEQDAEVRFVTAAEVRAMRGVGALLRY